MKRIFWIVLDSAGIGEAPDAKQFGDVGSNTWKSCFDSGMLSIPNMEKLGIYQIDGMEYAESKEEPIGSYARMQELSCGKDTTTGHWEMAGIVTPDPLPKFPNGFPEEFIEEFSKRTGRRHDFSLAPPRETVLDALKSEGKDVIGVGKIYDIFEGQGVTETYPNQGNEKNMEQTIALQKKEFSGLCYVNLVDGDMIYGHRRDINGYAKALTRFDEQLGEFLANMQEEDMLMITADHGCDPGYTGTDHTREYVPCLIYGKEIKEGVNLHTRKGFADMAATIAEALGSEYRGDGKSFWEKIRN